MEAQELNNCNWEQAIRRLGKKATPQRKAILAALAEQDRPATVDEIFIKVREQQKTSLSTIYRNLDLLLSQGLINKQGFPGEKARYSLKKDDHEHTLVCMDCQKIVTITGCPLEAYAAEIASRENFVVLDHRMEMYGYCHKCMQAKGRV
jgi:Fur family ferric uptake transcriptional regulator